MFCSKALKSGSLSLSLSTFAGLFLLLFTPCFSASASQADIPAATAHKEGSHKRDIARMALVEELDRFVESTPLAESRVGIHVVSLSTQEEIYARGADVLLNPASNIKLVTAAAALELLGPEYRFKIEVWLDSAPNHEGFVNGNIYIKGFGDPSFLTERMSRLSMDLWNLGVRRVGGDIIIDETFFDRVREGPGWDHETSDRAYIAPVGALSLNRNAVAITIRAGASAGGRAEVSVDPDSSYFVVDNRVVTGSRSSNPWYRPSSIAEGNRQRILVSGVHPIHVRPRTLWRRIDNPPMYFAHTFREFMSKQGVRFDSRRIRLRAVPNSASLFHISYSEPLTNVIGPLNKFSNNNVAETLLKTLGAELRGEPGTWEKGADAVEEFLQFAGLERGSYVFRNASGLNDVNRISARQFTSLLAYMWDRYPTSPEFIVSLPVSGRDGTTRWRMEEAAGWVRAKTGTLENVSGLSGYVGTPSGEVLAFSVMVNDYPGSLRDVIAGIDGVPIRLSSFDGGANAKNKKVAGRPVPVAPTEALSSYDERAALYFALHAAADRRNIRYLKRLLDDEGDAVLRMVVADAIFRSDQALGAYILLDEFVPSAESVGRLRRLAVGPDIKVPVLSSIATLAMGRCPHAIRAFLSAGCFALGHDALEPWFAERLEELGRAAPKELVAGLLEMGLSEGNDAVTLLARGLGETQVESGRRVRDEHPLREAMKTSSAELLSGDSSSAPEATAAAALVERWYHYLFDDGSLPGDGKQEAQGEDGNSESEDEDEKFIDSALGSTSVGAKSICGCFSRTVCASFVVCHG